MNGILSNFNQISLKFMQLSNQFICKLSHIVFVSLVVQLSEQIQNLTVSSTTSNSGTQQPLSGSGKSSTNITEKNSNNNNSTLTNILKDTAAAVNGNSVKENLAQRVKFLQTKLAYAPMPSITSKRRQLPSIEEAWNLPISAEMSSRQQQTVQSNQQRAYAKNYNHVSEIHFLFIQFFYSFFCSAKACKEI